MLQQHSLTLGGGTQAWEANSGSLEQGILGLQNPEVVWEGWSLRENVLWSHSLLTSGAGVGLEEGRAVLGGAVHSLRVPCAHV